MRSHTTKFHHIRLFLFFFTKLRKTNWRKCYEEMRHTKSFLKKRFKKKLRKTYEKSSKKRIRKLISWLRKTSKAHAEIRTKNWRNRRLLTSDEDMKILRRFYEVRKKFSKLGPRMTKATDGRRLQHRHHHRLVVRRQGRPSPSAPGSNLRPPSRTNHTNLG